MGISIFESDEARRKFEDDFEAKWTEFGLEKSSPIDGRDLERIRESIAVSFAPLGYERPLSFEEDI